MLLLSLSNCSGCNTPKEQKTKEDKIPGINKLITDIKQYMKNPPPSGSSSLSNIIDELQKYTIDNSSDIDGILIH